jgi:predicted Zn-dependent protease
LLNSEKQYREARSVLADAVARETKNALLKGDLIRMEAAIDGLDAALSKAREFAKDDPDNRLYDLISAELYEKAGRAKDALAVLEKAVAARHSDDRLTVALSRVYSGTGDLKKAEAVLTHRLATDPNNPAVRAVLGRLYLNMRRIDDAKKTYEALLARGPTSPPFSASEKPPLPKRNGWRPPTISTALAPLRPTTRRPG